MIPTSSVRSAIFVARRCTASRIEPRTIARIALSFCKDAETPFSLSPPEGRGQGWALYQDMGNTLGTRHG